VIYTLILILIFFSCKISVTLNHENVWGAPGGKCYSTYAYRQFDEIIAPGITLIRDRRLVLCK